MSNISTLFRWPSNSLETHRSPRLRRGSAALAITMQSAEPPGRKPYLPSPSAPAPICRPSFRQTSKCRRVSARRARLCPAGSRAYERDETGSPWPACCSWRVAHEPQLTRRTRISRALVRIQRLVAPRRARAPVIGGQMMGKRLMSCR